MFLNLQTFLDFSVSLILLWSESRHCMNFISLNLFRYVYGPGCGLSWWMFRVNLRRMYILLLLNKMFYKWQLDPIDWLYNRNYVLLIFCLLDLPITDRRVLKSPTIIVVQSFFPCSSTSFCLLYFDALLLGTRILSIVMSSLRISYYVIPLFIPHNFPCPEVCSV